MEKHLKIYTSESLCCMLETNTVLYKLIILHLKKSVPKILCTYIPIHKIRVFTNTVQTKCSFFEHVW